MKAQMLVPKCIYPKSIFVKCESSKYKKFFWARLGVSKTIYVNVDSPNLGFTYFNFLDSSRQYCEGLKRIK